MIKRFYALFIILIFAGVLFGQERNTQLGTPNVEFRNYNTGLYDFSDPASVNIKVSVWGFLRYPGRYIVPQYTTLNDLISYAGGPESEANMDDLRVYRVLDNGKEQMIKFTYDDLLYENKLEVNNRVVPKLQAGDILIVPGAPRLYFKDYFSIALSIFSALTSLVILIFTIVKK